MQSIKKNSKRQRIKSRKLFKGEDDEEGSGSGCFDNTQDATKNAVCADESIQQSALLGMLANQSTPVQLAENLVGIVTEKQQLETREQSSRVSKDVIDGRLSSCCTNENMKSQRQPKSNQITENIYESAPVSQNETTAPASKTKCEKVHVTVNNTSSCCQDFRAPNQSYQARKLGRKSRSRKPKHLQEVHPAARIRSLSVGNENSFRNSNGDASSGVSVKGNDECLNNLRRNDLIDIIRESMEKSRLCFQSNG